MGHDLIGGGYVWDYLKLLIQNFLLKPIQGVMLFLSLDLVVDILWDNFWLAINFNT